MVRQFAALPYRLDNGTALRFLLVTSRHSGHWIIPKGNRIASLDGHGSAAQEAFEEGGVEGEIATTPIGCFRIWKRWLGVVPLRAEVEVYPLRVDRLADDWPEAGQRRRQWFDRAQAESAVREASLRRVIREFEPGSALQHSTTLTASPPRLVSL